MRPWGLSTMNIGEYETQLAWGKRKLLWESREFFIGIFRDNKGK